MSLPPPAPPVHPAVIRFTLGPEAAGLPPPAPATPGASGADLRAALPAGPMTIVPGAVALVPTGLRVEIPAGHEIQVRPRSGLAAKYGVTVLNSPGTIDSDYRGEIRVILVNHGPDPFSIAHGDRIAQMVVAAVAPCTWEPAGAGGGALSETARGQAGFGSTGRA